MPKLSLCQILRTYFPGGSENYDPFDFIHAFGKPSRAILYSALFVPDFEEYAGSIFFASNLASAETKARFTAAAGTVKSARELEEMESSFNFIEVGYLFSATETSDEEDEYLAEVIATSWKAQLKYRFPERKFVVEVLPPEVTGSTVGVHFFEKRTSY